MIQLIVYKAIEPHNALELIKAHAMKIPFQLFLKAVFLLFTLIFFNCLIVFPQDKHLVDSLNDIVAVTKDDTNKVKLLYKIGDQYRHSILDSAIYYYNAALGIAENIEENKFIAQCLIAVGVNLNSNGSSDKAMEFLERALNLSEEIGDKEKMSTCLLNMGTVNIDLGIYDKAIEFYLKALETAKEINFKKGISRSYNSLGIAYYDQGSYDESIEYFLKALKIHEELGDKQNMTACYNNIGLIHQEQGSYDKAIEYLQKALAIHEERSDKRGMSICYFNIGNIFNKQGSYDKAIEYYNRALKQFEELGDKRAIANSTHNLGETYENLGFFNKAVEYLLRALRLYEEIGDKMGIAITDVSIANLNVSLADSVAVTESQRLKYLNQAIAYGNKSIVNAKEMNLMPQIKGAAKILMTTYGKLGNYKKAMEFAGILITTQDSMFTEDKTRAIQEMSSKYETEKKQQQIEIQESQLIAKDARIKQQKTFRNALIGGLGAIVIIVFVIAYAYVQKRKDNKKISEQNDKILRINIDLKQLNETITRQKDEIISSINYARRIQSAILPPERYITELLKENFIFFKPKEIVSGDFYWITQVKNYIILASADCTGHGVPGAFMSMLGISYLNEIVQVMEITQANQILNELRKQIILSLRQSGEKTEPKDGMDIALCVIDNEKRIMQYSGANNPLYIINNNNGESLLREIKGDPMPVGVTISSEGLFTNHEIKLENGDTFYIFSDGFIDQSGGDKGQRFTSKRFKNMLLDIHNQPLVEQKEIIERNLKNWMGVNAQRDDILVIGARV